MEEESDNRKINNSFLRDHNYATEGKEKVSEFVVRLNNVSYGHGVMD